jgi:hypothetical protein
MTALWLVVREPWAEGFRSAGNLLAAVCGAGSRISLAPDPQGAEHAGLKTAISTADTVVRIRNSESSGAIAVTIGSFRLSYVPLSVFLSLTLASGAVRKRMRARAMAAGLAGVVVFVVASGMILVLRTGSRVPGLDLWKPEPTLGLLIELSYRVFVNPPAWEYVVPAVIWLASYSIWAEPSTNAAVEPTIGRPT